MSGSPHGVLGWTQPFGVSMKWLASLGGPRIDWPCAVTTNVAGARAPSSAMRSVSMIRCIVTPKSALGFRRAALDDHCKRERVAALCRLANRALEYPDRT